MNPLRSTIKQQVADLLVSPAVTRPTRRALYERLHKEQLPPRFFRPDHFHLLNTVCDRLVDQDPGNRLVNIAAFIDDRLAQGLSDGWRYDGLPPDGDMLLQGLTGIEETAGLRHQKSFLELDKAAQLDVLQAVQQGDPPGQVWSKLPPARFFEELLAETVEIYFSDPSVQLEMDYLGMMDAYGWKNIGLNENDPVT